VGSVDEWIGDLEVGVYADTDGVDHAEAKHNKQPLVYTNEA
jgi:hypothetical protein